MSLTREELTDPKRRLSYPFEKEAQAYSDGTGEALVVCAYGGGLNSTAYLVLLKWLGKRPDLILFADTGGEKPETYEHVGRMSAWCEANGFPAILTVKRKVDFARQKHAEKYTTLEEECLVKKNLPSIAYYGRSCSEKWKQQPQNKYVDHWEPAQKVWEDGGRVLKVIGYDADEARRAKIFSHDKYLFWYPLLEYDWGRAECRRAIELEGLPVPPKSSCWFCPEMKPREIFELRDKHPELLERALAIESNAVLTKIKGLGKHKYSWKDLLDGKVELPLVKKAEEEETLPCNCYDGGGGEEPTCKVDLPSGE